MPKRKREDAVAEPAAKRLRDKSPLEQLAAMFCTGCSLEDSRKLTAEFERLEARLRAKKELQRTFPLVKRASFMGIPGELRNIIYRLAVLTKRIIIVRETYVEPGILRTSSKIRKEALSIYRHENKFKLHVWHHKLEPQPGHWVLSLSDYDTAFHGRKSWSNFKAWLHLLWQRVTYQQKGVGRRIQQFQSLDIPRRNFVVRTIIALGRDGVPWTTIEKVLEAYKDDTMVEAAWED